MTNPLSEQELAALKAVWIKHQGTDPHGATHVNPSHDDEWQDAQHYFAAALDYLRAEQAKEEPVAAIIVEDDGAVNFTHYPLRLPPPGDHELYLRPSEPTPCPFIETSQEGTSYCRLAEESTKENSQ